jgi:TPR repeat protein
MEYEPTWRLNISDICRDFYKLSKKHSKSRSYDSTQSNEIEYSEDYDENLSAEDASPSYITIQILTVEDAIRTHKSKNGSRQLAWQSFKHHSSTNIEAKYWLGYYYYHDKEIPELQQIDKEERIKIAVEIFKETADKGNPSAQLRYGICLWQGEGIKANSFEAIKYLKFAADSGNSTAMYIIGKAYWNGGNGINQDKDQGADYLKKAARNEHPKAREMCIANRIF